MVADKNGIEREFGPKSRVNQFYRRARLRSFCNIGLVSDHQKEKSGRFKVRESFRHAGKDFERVKRIGRVGFAITYDRAVENAVTVEKDGGAEG